jgi:hypothetical protein
MVGRPVEDNRVNDGLAIGRQWDPKPASIVFDTDYSDSAGIFTESSIESAAREAPFAFP